MEYRYITQDVIDKGAIKVNSSQEYDEAQRYNEQMRKEYKKRRTVYTSIALWSGLQFLFVAIGLYYNCMDVLVDEKMVSDTRGILWFLGSAIFIVVYSYFIIAKKLRTPLVAFLVSLPLCLASLRFIGVAVINPVLAHLYQKYESSAKELPGYPGFARLTVTYLRDDSRELTYDKIREKAKNNHPHDEGFL